MKLMNEAVQVLRPGTGEDEDFKELVSQATSFRKILSQVKPSPKDAQNGTTLNWQANAKALTVYKVGSVISCTPNKDIRFYPGIENLILPMLAYP